MEGIVTTAAPKAKARTTALAERLYWLAGWVYDFSKVATIVLALVLLVNYFLYSLMIVQGTSMVPNFHTGNIELVSRWAYDFSRPQRGDVVALYFPGETQQRFIKRIIGLPGETVTISNGQVFINNQLLNEQYLPANTETLPDMTRTLAANQYFVLGDNRSVSSDSRAWGTLPSSDIIGQVIGRI